MPAKVELHESAMGTRITMAAFTAPELDEARVRRAMQAALAEMRRLESLMSSWREDSEIGQLNAHAGRPRKVSSDTFAVIKKSLWASRISQGTFDITFQSMSGLWQFGDAQAENPKPPLPEQVRAKRRLVDYRKLLLDEATSSVTVAPSQRIGLGGIAKGYIVDRASEVLRRHAIKNFLVQAGGDLYGAGRKPDGPWISGVQDPRSEPGRFFASIELEDYAFSTAGDYARYYLYEGRRYHHIIDPRTGYPATASRSVTVWAPTALLADAVDDAVFILGPEEGLKLVESLPGVGAVIVDAQNKVWISQRLRGKLKLLAQPTDGI